MEGTRCSQLGCSVHDFLPFECPKCEKWYCVDHRSRFSHECLATLNDATSSSTSDSKTDQSSGFSVKSLFQSITGRFGSSSSIAAPSHHQYAIHSSKPAPLNSQDAVFQNSVQKLDSISVSSTNEKTRRISAKTREMLIKSRATGNDSCVFVDRFYFMIHFDPLPAPPLISTHLSLSGKEEHQEQEDLELRRATEKLISSIKAATETTKYLFFPHHWTLGEMLYHVKQEFSELLVFIGSKLNTGLTRSEDIGLSVQTKDTIDWKYWNSLKDVALNRLFTNFEEIWIAIVPLSQILSLQTNPIHKLMSSTQTSAPAEIGLTPVENSSLVKDDPSDTIPSDIKRVYKQGDRVWYYKHLEANSDGTSNVISVFSSFLEAYEQRNSIALQLAEIVGVHHDDFPNIYYTISLLPASSLSLSSLPAKGEKQTDARHLLPCHPSEEKLVLEQQLQSMQQQYQQIGNQIVRLNIWYKNQEVASLCLGNGITIAQLKQLITQYVLPQFATTSNSIKLICKGTILKDSSQTLAKNAKISDGVKIMVMGSESG